MGLSDVTTDASDYGAIEFSNGVSFANGEITVPAGVTAFNITVKGAEDSVIEPDETFTISVGGVESTGTITNDDGALSVSSVTQDVTAEEGDDLVFAVTMNGEA